MRGASPSADCTARASRCSVSPASRRPSPFCSPRGPCRLRPRSPFARVTIMADAFRTEKDPLGPKQVAADALYGVQTMRARENFPISELRPLWPFVVAQVWIKKAAALTHKETGRLDARL